MLRIGLLLCALAWSSALRLPSSPLLSPRSPVHVRRAMAPLMDLDESLGETQTSAATTLQDPVDKAAADGDESESLQVKGTKIIGIGGSALVVSLILANTVFASPPPPPPPPPVVIVKKVEAKKANSAAQSPNAADVKLTKLRVRPESAPRPSKKAAVGLAANRLTDGSVTDSDKVFGGVGFLLVGAALANGKTTLPRNRDEYIGNLRDFAQKTSGAQPSSFSGGLWGRGATSLDELNKKSGARPAARRPAARKTPARRPPVRKAVPKRTVSKPKPSPIPQKAKSRPAPRPALKPAAKRPPPKVRVPAPAPTGDKAKQAKALRDAFEKRVALEKKRR